MTSNDDDISVDDSDDELQEAQDLLENHIGTCMSLYDEYTSVLSDYLVKHPVMAGIRPEHDVERNDMSSARWRELFFDYYIAHHAIPALRAHLLII